MFIAKYAVGMATLKYSTINCFLSEDGVNKVLEALVSSYVTTGRHKPEGYESNLLLHLEAHNGPHIFRYNVNSECNTASI
jgi:hypothetical protein